MSWFAEYLLSICWEYAEHFLKYSFGVSTTDEPGDSKLVDSKLADISKLLTAYQNL